MANFFNSTSLVPGGLLYGAGSTAMNPQTNGTMIGGLLNTLGAGLLSYGSGGDIGEAVQRQGALNNQFINDRLQRAGMVQQLRQSGITNAINNASALEMLNWKLYKAGRPGVTMDQFIQNPDQYAQVMSQPMAPGTLQSQAAPQGLLPSVAPQQGASAGALLPVQVPQSSQPAPPKSVYDFQPQSAGPSGMSMPSAPPQSAPSLMPAQVPQQPQIPQISTIGGQGLTPDVAQMIQWDALHNKDYADMELKLVQAGMPYIQAKAQVEQFAKDYRTVDANGNIVNMPGAVQAGAQVAGANSFATSQGSLPAQETLQSQRGAIERMNDVNKASITPYVQTVQTGPNTFQDVNTNNLAASRSALPGNMKFTPEQNDNQKSLADYKAQLTTGANEAQAQNIQLNQMLDTMKGFDPSKLAPYKMAAAAWLNGAGLSSADTDKALSNYQEFSKIATQQATAQARLMGAKEAASIVTMMVNNNPNASMTPAAITDMLNTRKAVNDYGIAKSQAADAYYRQNGTVEGFDTLWQQSHPPISFLAPYLRADQLTGQLGKQALPYLSQQQLIQLRAILAGQRTP